MVERNLQCGLEHGQVRTPDCPVFVRLGPGPRIGRVKDAPGGPGVEGARPIAGAVSVMRAPVRVRTHVVRAQRDPDVWARAGNVYLVLLTDENRRGREGD